MLYRKKTLFLTVLLAALLVTAASLAPAGRASAQAGFSPMDIINGVNALRASRGLAPYQVDSELMAYAQGHANYQASINTATHQHNDNSTSWQAGLEENIATGTSGSLTVDFVIGQIWADAIHMKTMVDYSSGFIGAGLAMNGTEIYITINVRPGNRTVPQATAGPNQPAPGTATPFIPLVALVTTTPRADGLVIHKVGYGQTLWDIAKAYQVKLADLRALNSMPADSNDIYANQRLLVKVHAPTPLPPIATAAVIQPAASAAPAANTAPTTQKTDTLPLAATATSEKTQNLTPLSTPSATAARAPVQSGTFMADKKTIAFVLIGICTLGLAAVAASSFRK